MTDKPAVPLAEVAGDWSRPLGSDPRDPVPGKPVEVAKGDLLIERTDLESDSHTQVNAGDPIPPGLADLPRKAARKGKA